MVGRPSSGASVLMPVQIPSLRAASGVPPRRAVPAATRVAEPAVERRPFAAFLKEGESKQAWTEQTEPRRAQQDIYGQAGSREIAQSASGAFFGGVGAPVRPPARYDDLR